MKFDPNHYEYTFARRLFGYKFIEINLSSAYSWMPFEFSLRWMRKVDHPGFRFNLSLFFFHFQIMFYDSRHWDSANNRFVDPDTEEK